MDETRREIADGHVVCEGGRIAAVGAGPAPAVAPVARRIDGRGMLATPGLIVATHDLLARNPAPNDAEIREALAGNLCRCTGYEGIVAAARAVAGEGR